VACCVVARPPIKGQPVGVSAPPPPTPGGYGGLAGPPVAARCASWTAVGRSGIFFTINRLHLLGRGMFFTINMLHWLGRGFIPHVTSCSGRGRKAFNPNKAGQGTPNGTPQRATLRAKVAARLLHPQRRPWKSAAHAAFDAALLGLGVGAILTSLTPQTARSRGQPRRLIAYGGGAPRKGVAANPGRLERSRLTEPQRPGPQRRWEWGQECASRRTVRCALPTFATATTRLQEG
jgi:hypothetical protein